MEAIRRLPGPALRCQFEAPREKRRGGRSHERSFFTRRLEHAAEGGPSLAALSGIAGGAATRGESGPGAGGKTMRARPRPVAPLFPPGLSSNRSILARTVFREIPSRVAVCEMFHAVSWRAARKCSRIVSAREA